ncbi:glycosyltransferase [Glycomyces sp. L485]|uniref:CgeB family protein n=1 Tax=Glycomyces sp. L485 TaxID=2909235 RepID=UPI001F4AC378|nr:glycosyltransferase [Glycomyces sp. L485]MCH7230593.1 glycosyltransferase [Glycomyces sp. L485]
MHIGLIGRRGPDTFQANIGDGLLRLGHRVTYLGLGRAQYRSHVANRVADLAASAVHGLEDLRQHSLVRAALESECDAVLNTYGGLTPRTVASLRRNGLPVALWFPDAVSNLGRQLMLMAPYSAIFFKDPLLVRRLRDTLGLPVRYLPQGCNPHWHRPIGRPGTRRVIAVVGNCYPSRAVLLRRLHEAGLPLVIYGAAPRWVRGILPPRSHTGHPVFAEDKAKVFREAAAVLNNLHPAEIHGVNARLFEAAGSGAAVLCERRAVLGDLFDLDSEVVPFTDFDELTHQAKRLLDDPDMTQRIGDAASRRAHADHTYEKRLPEVLERLS